MRKGYCVKNPCVGVEQIKKDEEEPRILDLSSLKKLLKCAYQYKDGILFPYITLSAFAAIRPAELGRITWKNIDFEDYTLTIKGGQAKMRNRRIVQLEQYLIDALLPFSERGLPFVNPNFRKDFEQIRKNAGIEKWINDVLRHTAISYHLAKYQHEGKTASWAGNSPDIIQKHYKGLVKPKDLVRYEAFLANL